MSSNSSDSPTRLTIGQAAKGSGISAKMIRYYERVGLIPDASRTEAGYRTYDAQDVHALVFIRRARDLGFTVKKIKELLRLWQDHTRSSSEVQALARAHVEELTHQLHQLQSIIDTLSHLVTHCHGDERPDCPIIKNLADLMGQESDRDLP